MAAAGATARTASLHDQRARRVQTTFDELPGRYLGAPDDFRATFEIRLGDIGRTWVVRLRGAHCEVGRSPTGAADVTIGTDAATWLGLREGRLSGLDAFSQRRLYARGDLDLALGFEGMFRLPGEREPLMRIMGVDTSAGRLSSLISGDGVEQVICLHGLGANKTSFFETVAALAPACTVHAVDLPGFGTSDKPARGAYDAQWFAEAVRSYMDATGVERAHMVGNSMGGRIAIEVAFDAPDQVASLSLLAPALAFRRRHLAPIVRLLRPELAVIPHALREPLVRRHFHDLFAEPERLDPAAADVAVDEFCRLYRSRAARVAFFAAARHIYLDEPHGEDGFYARLARLEPPALFVWGEHDRIIPPGFSRHVADALPRARQVILDDCGHVPQVEFADRTNLLIKDMVASASSPAPRAAATPGRIRRALRRAG